MYACPVCKGSTIGFYRKWLSTPVLPAYCRACSTYSHAHRASGGLGVVVGAVLITAGGITASALQAVWPLALGIGLAVTFYIRHIHRIPLEGLSPQQVLRARETEGMSWLALLAALFLTS